LEAFLRTSASDLFLLSDDTLVPTRVLGRLLVRSGIPYVLIADGFHPPLKSPYRLSLRYRLSVLARRILYGWGPRGTGGAHRILVMTRTCQKALEACGVAPERIRVVGSPEYDQLAANRDVNDDASAARSIRQRLHLSADRPIVFYAHQEISGHHLTEALVWSLSEACRRIGATLLVKFHPQAHADPARWRALAQRRGIEPSLISFFKTECTSIEAVQVCSVCVTAFSTVSLEAMILGRPVIVLQYLPVGETLRLAQDYGAALDVEKSESLADAIRAAVQDGQVRAKLLANATIALHEELHSLDGRSLERIVTAILEVGAMREGVSPRT
jgi:UDP-N-acetylglucosamine 2-epimerase